MTSEEIELKRQLGDQDQSALVDTIIAIGKQRRQSLAREVIPFLSHPDGAVRAAAAQVVGFHFGMLSERDALVRMALSDPDDDARQAAVFGLGGIFRGSKDGEILRLLDGLLRDERVPSNVRALSALSILEIGGVDRTRFRRPAVIRDIARDVPWALIDEVVANASSTPGAPAESAQRALALDAFRERLSARDELEVIDAILDVGKQRIRPLTAEIGRFLTHGSAGVRGAAAQTLGFHLGASEYEETIRKIAEHEPDTDARMAAMMGWASLHAGSKSAKVMAILDRWLLDPSLPRLVRETAFDGLLRVAGVPSKDWPDLHKGKDFDAELPRALVDGLMGRKTTGPELAQLGEIPQRVRQQLESGAVWRSRDDTHPHDGLLRAIRSAGTERPVYAAAVLALLTSDDLRHRTGAVGVLFEVVRDLGAGRVAGVLRDNVALLRGVRPAWPIGEDDLEHAAIMAVAPHVKADGSGAIQWLREQLPRIAAAADPDQPWISAVLVALARVDTDWFLAHAVSHTNHAQIELIKALPIERRAAYIAAKAPWPPEQPDSLTRFFWKGFPPEESARLRALMWPEAS